MLTRFLLVDGCVEFYVLPDLLTVLSTVEIAV